MRLLVALTRYTSLVPAIFLCHKNETWMERALYLDKDQWIANAFVNKIERQQDIEVQKIVSF